MMKKILVFLLAAILSFSLMACGDKEEVDQTPIDINALVSALIPEDAQSEVDRGLAVYYSEKSFGTNYKFLLSALEKEGVESVEEGIPSQELTDEDGKKLSEWMYIGKIGAEEATVIVSLVGDDSMSNVIIAVGEEAVQAIWNMEE